MAPVTVDHGSQSVRTATQPHPSAYLMLDVPAQRRHEIPSLTREHRRGKK